MADGSAQAPGRQSLPFDPFASGAVEAALPTVNAQREVWTAMMADPAAAAAYNDTMSVILTGPVDTALAAQALQRLVDRHPALRAAVSDDGLDLTILASVSAAPDRIDLRDLSRDDRMARIAEIEADHVNRPPDLSRAPSLRSTLIREAPDRLRIVLTVTHMLCDGLSWQAMLEDLATVYRCVARGLPVPPAGHSLIDYAEEAMRLETPEALAPHIAYWADVYADGGPEWSLPCDLAPPARRQWSCGRVDRLIPASLMQALHGQAKRIGITGHGIVLAAFAAFLQRLSGSRDVTVGVPVAGQADFGMTDMIGHAVHMMPLRATAEDGVTFADFARQIRRTLLEARDHSVADFGILLDRLALPRERSRVPLCPAVFNIDTGMDRFDFGPVEAVTRSVPRQADAFEMFLDSLEREEGLELTWYFADWLFDRATVERHAQTFEALLRAVAAAPEAALDDLDLLGPDERAEILALGTAPALSVGRQTDVLTAVAAKAADAPDAVAVADASGRLTYAETMDAVSGLAATLIAAGLKPGDRVAVHLDRTVAIVLAPMAIWWAGGVYVPIDPAFPDARKREIAEDAKPRLLLHDGDLGPPPSGLAPTVVPYGVPADGPKAPRAAIQPESEAYLIFTSGSTGRPKGMAIPHDAFANFMAGAVHRLGGTADMRLLAQTTVSFDPSLLDFFLPLLSGGAIFVADSRSVREPTALADIASREGITHWQATPQSWRMLLTVDWPGDPKLTCLSVGEQLPPDIATVLLARCKALWNLYGPTETTLYATFAEVTDPRRITVGTALPGYRVAILDPRKRLQPPGFVGEIAVSGIGVAAGYIDRPDETAAAFGRDPSDPDLPCYWTGDLGTMTPDGRFRHLGRGDTQIKLRGYRIELNEVESALNADADVAQAAAVLLAPGTAEAELAAAIVPTGTPPSPAALRSRLANRLPTYMVPTRFETVSTLPRTGTGKLHRRSIAALFDGPATATARAASSPRIDVLATPAAPRPAPVDTAGTGTVLDRVLEDWRTLLRRADAGPDDRFFDGGGHSLQAAQLIVALNRRFGVTLTLGDLIANDTPRGIASLVGEHRAGNRATHLVPMAAGPSDRPPLILLPPQGGQLLRYEGLARALDGRLSVYGFEQSADLLSLTSTDLIADRALSEIQERWPQGPIALGGYSYGGILAFRAAQRLQAQGREPALLVLIDALNWPRETLLFKLRRAWLEARYTRPFAPWLAEKIGRNALKAVGRYTPEDLRDTALVDDPTYTQLMTIHDNDLLAFSPSPFSGPALTLRAGGDPILNRLLPGGGIDDFLIGPTSRRTVDVACHNEVVRPPAVDIVAREILAALVAE